MNAVTFDTLKQLEDAFETADQDDSARVVIVTGTGRGFCAGTDPDAGQFPPSGRVTRRPAAACRWTKAATSRCASST